MNKRIPKHAKLVHSGEIFKVYEWEQQMFDGSTHVFETAVRPDTVNVIAIGEDGLVYYAEEQQPDTGSFLSIFGGRIDHPDEDPLDAAKRELLEESGMVSDDWELYFEVDFPGKIIWKTSTFIAKNCKKIAEQKLDSGEKITVTSCTVDEFINVVNHPKFRDLDLRQHLFNALNTEKLNKLKTLLKK